MTLLLKPVIVTLHLLGGMTLVAFLAWLSARHLQPTGGQPSALRSIRPLVAVAHNGIATLLLAALVMLNLATRSPSLFGR